VLAFKRVVFLVIDGLVVDQTLCVLAVLCGENSSKNPITSGFRFKDWSMFFLTVFQRQVVFYNP
jgi:hypothetical protein